MLGPIQYTRVKYFQTMAIYASKRQWPERKMELLEVVGGRMDIYPGNDARTLFKWATATMLPAREKAKRLEAIEKALKGHLPLSEGIMQKEQR